MDPYGYEFTRDINVHMGNISDVVIWLSRKIDDWSLHDDRKIGVNLLTEAQARLERAFEILGMFERYGDL